MTIEQLDRELKDGDGSYDLSMAAHIHTRTVASAAVSVESVIRDLDLLNKETEAIDPAEILRDLVNYTEDEGDRRLFEVLSGAASQLREFASTLTAEQATAFGDLVQRLQGAQSIVDLHSILGTYEDSDIPGVGEGASYARGILRDGEETIYNPVASPIAAVAGDPDDPPRERSGRAVLAVATEDAAGGIGGAVAGTFFFGVGALPGAVGGAVSTSVASIVKRTLKRLLSRG